MMGDRDFQSIIRNSVSAIGRELDIEIDADNIKKIHLHEATQCLRRSFYDRVEPEEIERRGFNELVSGLLRKLQYGSEPKDFDVDDIKIRGQADMIADDAIILFRPAIGDIEDPKSNDVLYLNACMWIYDKVDGVIVYITGDRKETMFSLARNKKMFEEVIRRVRVLNNLLKEKKAPILEPSNDCAECQYYARCFVPKKHTEKDSLAQILGFSKKK